MTQANLSIELNRSGLYESEGEKKIGAKAFQFRLKSVLEMRARQLEAVQQRFA